VVAPIAPIFTWQDGKLRSPQEVARERSIAEALMFAKPQAEGFWGALGQIGSAASGSILDSRADAYEEQGREQASNLFSGLGAGSSADAISAALLDPAAAWATPAQSSVAEALFNNELRQSDPAYQLDLAYKQAQLDALNNPAMLEPTSAIQNYEYLVRTGVDPSTAQTMAFGGGGTSINNYGSIPSGYEVFTDPATGATQMRPIPGGPAALDAEAAARAAEAGASQDQTLTDTVVNAAQLAREAFSSGGLTSGTLGKLLANLPESQAAEVRRQTKVLAGNAIVGNLQAMRDASPTGGALGSVTEGELALLQSLQGALDPDSPTFLRDLDNFERTFLETVHGREAGRQIFEQTRQNSGQAETTTRKTSTGVEFSF
jgi:hypothetical protein